MEKSRKKLTKKQLANLRSHNWFIFERTMLQCYKRMTYIKAVIQLSNDRELYKYTWKRLLRFKDKLNILALEEFKSMGIVPKDRNAEFLNWDKKTRSVKLSIENR